MSEEPRRPIGCPECGGEMLYDRKLRSYACKSCGLVMTRQELQEERRRLISRVESDEERRERERKEYLKWWLSKKE
ncbi:MAG: hypothetical protein ACE5OY_04125 [Candidatus Bathyarchaeia archaeon]